MRPLENHDLGMELRRLMMAIHNNDINTVKIMVQERPQLVNMQDNDFKTLPLHRSIRKDQLEIMELLISYGANINGCAKPHKSTPLIEAAYCNRLEAIKFLLSKKAKINVKNKEGFTALDIAAEYSSIEVIDYLLKNKARSSGAIIARACCSNRTDVVEYLLKLGFPFKNWRGLSPLHWAASRADCEIVKLLIRFGADINSRDSKKRTPLHEAAGSYNENVGMILDSVVQSTLDEYYVVSRILIEKGARTDARDRRGRTPMDTAIANRRGSVILALDNDKDHDKYREEILERIRQKEEKKKISIQRENEVALLLIVHDQFPSMRNSLINSVFDKLQLPINNETPIMTIRNINANKPDIILPLIPSITEKYFKEHGLKIEMGRTKYEPFKIEIAFPGEPLEPYEGYAFALFGKNIMIIQEKNGIM